MPMRIKILMSAAAMLAAPAAFAQDIPATPPSENTVPAPTPEPEPVPPTRSDAPAPDADQAPSDGSHVGHDAARPDGEKEERQPE